MRPKKPLPQILRPFFEERDGSNDRIQPEPPGAAGKLAAA